MPTFQFMTKRDEVWTQADAAGCERDGDTVTLVDMTTADGTTIERFIVEIYDLVELGDSEAPDAATPATSFDLLTAYEALGACYLRSTPGVRDAPWGCDR